MEKAEDEAIIILAHEFAKRRNGPGVYMDGSDHPTPVDFQAATFFIRDLIHAGWVPSEKH